jgi:hypothetical protein
VRKKLNKIGRSEKIYFPKLNEGIITGKIDTGAFSAALHCDSIKVIDSGLQVKITNSTYIFHKWSEVDVKSSNGKSQKRYGVKLKMILGNKKYIIFVSLTSRKNMKYPLLIGRRFLQSNRFLVDVNKKNIHGRPKKI